MIIVPHRRKHFRGGGTTYSVKTLVIDIADSWGVSLNMGCRELDLVSSGSRLPLVQADYFAGSTTRASTSYDAKFMFDTSIILTGGSLSRSWRSTSLTNQRVFCLYDSIQSFEEILFNNYHHFGTETDRGLKNTKIYVTEDTSISTVYGAAVPNGTLIFDGILPEHSAVDEAQDYNIPLI